VEKPENWNYFRDPEHLKRVQEWRKRNPGYWKRKKRQKTNMRYKIPSMKNFKVVEN